MRTDSPCLSLMNVACGRRKTRMKNFSHPTATPNETEISHTSLCFDLIIEFSSSDCFDREALSWSISSRRFVSQTRCISINRSRCFSDSLAASLGRASGATEITKCFLIKSYFQLAGEIRWGQRFRSAEIQRQWQSRRGRGELFTSAYLTAASISARECPESSAFFAFNVLAITIRARSSCTFKRSSSSSFSSFVCSLN